MANPPAQSPLPRLKRAGVLRAAFDYQDLVGIELLVRFYRDRALYQWVELEADDPAYASIDDVVACRADGSLEMLQVKFTPDPEAKGAALDWSWLTTRARKGSSLLQKWGAALRRLQTSGAMVSARLRTNRRPDAAFANCLRGDRVDWARVPANMASQVMAQFEDEADAKAFFATFEFGHSEAMAADLEDRLRADVAFDLDGAGWLAFRRAVMSWATVRGLPEPDGRIRYVHLQQQLAARRPRPIPQDFVVPTGYEVPDLEFDAELLDYLNIDGVRVVWGPPGRGKSTYLSHCVERLRADGRVVCIRHHYFLDLADRSAARFHFHDIMHSLIAQLETERLSVPRDVGLSGALGAASSQLAADGRRLVIVIDGLDHVWREGRSVEHMAQLFAELLPLPPHATLVVGTQRAPDDQLPARLLAAAPKSDWLELPLMSGPAVARWVDVQNEAGRLNLRASGDRVAALRDIARAFHEISGGLPLHLIYAFESLVRSGRAITADDVRGLPKCPGADIRAYYAGLWLQVGPRAQQILHALAGAPFPFSPVGLQQCFGGGVADAEALSRIDHLLDVSDLGVFPFHGSLFVFVREQPGHRTAFLAQGPRLLDWLETQAPRYWRWAWTWLMRASLGADEDLVTGPTWAWAVEALTAGYPPGQVEEIVAAAERVALERFDLPRLIELRLLGTRVSNGPEFQLDHWDQFEAAARALADDPHVRLLQRLDLRDLDAGEMADMLRSASPGDHDKLADLALAEINRRILARLRDPRREGRRAVLDPDIGRVVAHVSTPPLERFLPFIRQFDFPDEPAVAFARESIAIRRPMQVLRLAEQFAGRDFDREVFTAAALDGVDPFDRLGPTRALDARLSALAVARGATKVPEPAPLVLGPVLAERDFSDESSDTRHVIGEAFFTELRCAIEGRDGPAWCAPATDAGEWIRDALLELRDAARAIGIAWREAGEPPSMAALYTSLPQITPPRDGYENFQKYAALRLAVRDVAIDLQALGGALQSSLRIAEDDIEEAATSALWLDDLWLDAFVRRPLDLHAPSGAAAVLDRLEADLAGGVTQFAQRGGLAVRCSLFAIGHGLGAAARDMLRRAARCVLGYGWRKDLFGLDVVESLEELWTAGDPIAKTQLLRLAPAFDQITEFTDGDETDHVRADFYRLLARVDADVAALAYGDLIHREEWRYADELIKALATNLPFGAGLRALLLTFLQPTEVSALEQLAKSGRADIRRTLADVRGNVGVGDPPPRPVKVKRPSLRSHRAPAWLSHLGPSDLSTLLAKSRGRGEHVSRWLRSCHAKGQGPLALACLARSLDEDPGQRFRDGLDLAYRISLETEGRAAAFSWLTRAHRANHGWSRIYTEHREALTRLDVVAEHYPDRWQEFVRETAKPFYSYETGRDMPVVGLSRLVHLLVRVGETGIARQCVTAMVNAIMAETSEQPLPALAWAHAA
jgi:hypothetical protein